MKKLSFALALAALLVAGPAIAAQPSSVRQSHSSVGSATPGNGGKGSMTNTVMETSVTNSNIITSGQGSETNISTIDNKGNMTNTVMETTIKDSNVISTGGGKTTIGKISNQ